MLEINNTNRFLIFIVSSSKRTNFEILNYYYLNDKKTFNKHWLLYE